MALANNIKTIARLVRFQFWRFDALRYRGQGLECPVCGGRFRRMKPFVGHCTLRGEYVDCHTENAVCPRCHSDIRQRFVLQFLRCQTDLFSRRQRVLHIAPEIGLYQLLREADLDYLPVDLNPERFAAAAPADVTDLPFASASFDRIICIHVLEHVEDDRKAIAEFFRVLRPGGSATIAVPTGGVLTYEVPGLDDIGRMLHYGACDHRRLNGLDFATKLRDHGFEVAVLSIADVPGNFVDRTVTSPHTESDRYLFACTRPLRH